MVFSFSKIFVSEKQHENTEVDKLFNFLALLTHQEEVVEGYLFRYNQLRRIIPKKGDQICINLYLEWEDFISTESTSSNVQLTKEDIRGKVKNHIKIDSLSSNFQLVFLEPNLQLSYLYGVLVSQLALYVKENLGESTLKTILKDVGRDTVFEHIIITPKEIDFGNIHEEIEKTPTDYPTHVITNLYKSFIFSLYNKIETSLGKNISQRIFKNLYENFKNTYDTDFAMLLLNVTPEKVLNLEEWLSLLSKRELEKQVREKTKELDDLNNSLEEKVRSRTSELKQAYEELKELDKKKTEFISVAAHQIRTPISGIKWVLNILLQEEVGKISDEQKSFLEKAYSANEQLLSIVNDLLDVDLMSKGQSVYQIKKLNIFDVIKNTITNLAPKANAHKVKIVWEKETNADEFIEGDPIRIKSVIENLLDNAIKYSNKGSDILIHTKHRNDSLSIQITNHGIGIPKDSQDEIFKRFYRAPNAIRLYANGSGLGLFIAKNIVNRHHGVLTFTSNENGVTTFVITLPTVQPDEH